MTRTRAKALLFRVIGRRGRAALLGLRYPAIAGPPPLDDEAELQRLREAAAAATGEVRLHIGCGPRILRGWLNIDLVYEQGEWYLGNLGDVYYSRDVRGDRSEFFAIDVTRGLPLPDQSVDVIFHEDFIEHLTQEEAVSFLVESRRVLREGGIHRINTPDLRSSMERHSDFERGLAGLYRGEWTQHGHQNVLTRPYLEDLASLVGYSRVEFNGRDHSSYQDLPREYRPAQDRPDDGNLFADLYR